MKITAIEAMSFRLPTRRDFKWAGLKVDLGGFVLIRVRTEGGVVGYGEATISAATPAKRSRPSPPP
jgi:L-alanine-DL-glutamate epimerase-like enolase superfamily enzyme